MGNYGGVTCSFLHDPVDTILGKRGMEPGGKVQKYIDSQVVRCCDPYCPMDTGMLKKATGTVYGSGEVRYNVPYAAKQYNSGRSPGTSAHGALRGRMWFERMKPDHKQAILQGAAQLAGAKIL